MTTPAIEAQGLVKRFAGQSRNVLNGLSFAIPRGQCVALLGPSGCGKTTLLRLLMGIEQPSAGSLRIDPALAGHLSYVFQEPRLVPYNDMALAPGMVVAIEPGIYLPGVGGVRLENVVLVTQDGCELLTRHLE